MQVKNELGWQNFLELCRHAESEEQLDELFDFLFTFEEKKSMATRILLVKELLKGKKTQREISQAFGISIAKITRGSNALKMISQDLQAYLQKKLLK